MAWRVAKSLDVILRQVDDLAPNRDRSNDGEIGDAAHAARTSDHNPDPAGIVHALDITHDPAHGVDTYALAELLRQKRDHRIKYVISNRRICGDAGYGARNGVPAWTWHAYTGENPHDHHVHVSVNSGPSADDAAKWDISLSAPTTTGEPLRPPLLVYGAKGDDVAKMQTLLSIKNFQVPINGDFDLLTQAAVVGFQTANGLLDDGKVGNYTWRALYAVVPAAPAPTTVPATPASGIIDIAKIAAIKSTIASYAWRDRGTAPIGFINGIGCCFARAVVEYKSGAAWALRAGRANTHQNATDALSWYSVQFAAVGMVNTADGIDTLRHLFALMLGLGMRESSGRYCEGRDRSASNVSADTAEAGLFQMSWNAHVADIQIGNVFSTYDVGSRDGFLQVFSEGVKVKSGDLDNYGTGTGRRFQELCKTKPAFAVETAAIGLRAIRAHWGPISRREAELRMASDGYLLEVQKTVTG